MYLQPTQPEELVQCELCHREHHKICVLHISAAEKFFCKNCCHQMEIEKSPIRAKSLPSSECDEFISEFLASYDVVPSNDITIRMLSSMDRMMSYQARSSKSDPFAFSYRDFKLLCFMETCDQNDVCFFAIHFQLHCDKCPLTNRRSPYISYIDSINFLPSSIRTRVYRFIILGLMKYLKDKGFEKVFLWSCPPQKDGDYIFYKKPNEMAMPTRARLSNWYTAFFQLGQQLNIIESFCGINDVALKEGWSNIADLPFFKGDHWASRISELTRKVNEKLETLLVTVDFLNARHKFRNSRSSTEIMPTSELKTETWNLISSELEELNPDYFVAQLCSNPKKSAQFSLGCKPGNNFINSRWLDQRHSFVEFFWDSLLEFSSERRAKYRTQVMLHRIFSENNICTQCSSKMAGEKLVVNLIVNSKIVNSCLIFIFSFL